MYHLYRLDVGNGNLIWRYANEMTVSLMQGMNIVSTVPCTYSILQWESAESVEKWPWHVSKIWMERNPHPLVRSVPEVQLYMSTIGCIHDKERLLKQPRRRLSIASPLHLFSLLWRATAWKKLSERQRIQNSKTRLAEINASKRRSYLPLVVGGLISHSHSETVGVVCKVYGLSPTNVQGYFLKPQD